MCFQSELGELLNPEGLLRSGKSNIRKLDMKAGVVMRLYPTTGQLRQEHCHKFKVRLSYIARHFPLPQPLIPPHLKAKQTNKQKILSPKYGHGRPRGSSLLSKQEGGVMSERVNAPDTSAVKIIWHPGTSCPHR